MSTAPVRRAAAAAVLALALTPLAGTAQAAVAFDESIHLSWDGTGYTGVTTESFLGTPVAVPGDSATRTLLVRNDGPSVGVLRASIVNVQLLDQEAPDIDGASFYEDLVLGWSAGSASFAELHENGATPFLEVELAKGAELPITLSYELPLEATTGNRANVALRQASFDVLLEIGGDLTTDPPTPEPTPVPTSSPPAGSAPPPPASGTSGTGAGGRLGATGVEARLLAGLAALAVGLGTATLVTRRRQAGGPPGH